MAQLLTRSFDRPVVADLARALRAGPAGSPGLALVAETVGRLVGQVQLSRSWLDAEQRLVQVLVLSPLGVLPEWQHRGIGSRLVTEVLSQARELGPPLVFLEGSPTYYHRFGFRPPGRPARLHGALDPDPARCLSGSAAPGLRTVDDRRPGLFRVVLGL